MTCLAYREAGLPGRAGRLILLFELCLCVALGGCTLGKGRPLTKPATGQPIVELHLLAMPVALNLDQEPGPDGFAVKVYAVSPASPKPVAITSGALEIFMFDGALPAADVSKASPRRVWSFSASELKEWLLETSIGVGYEFTLGWAQDKPGADRITILARYTPAQGVSIRSAPSSLSVAGR